MTFRVWYAIWVGEPSKVFMMRRSKKAAKLAVVEVKTMVGPDTKVGYLRLIEKIKARKRRTRRKHQVKQTAKGHVNAVLIPTA